MKFKNVPEFGNIKEIFQRISQNWWVLLRCIAILPVFCVSVCLLFLLFVLAIPVNGFLGCFSLLANVLKDFYTKDLEILKENFTFSDEDDDL